MSNEDKHFTVILLDLLVGKSCDSSSNVSSRPVKTVKYIDLLLQKNSYLIYSLVMAVAHNQLFLHDLLIQLST